MTRHTYHRESFAEAVERTAQNRAEKRRTALLGLALISLAAVAVAVVLMRYAGLL